MAGNKFTIIVTVICVLTCWHNNNNKNDAKNLNISSNRLLILVYSLLDVHQIVLKNIMV